jgi:mannose-1-phosphate guanylyltransferase
LEYGGNWSVVLAGGDGVRLQPLTWHFSTDGRPKQFCRLLDQRTLLGDTRDRLSSLVANERTLFVVNGQHRPFYREDLRDLVPYQLVEQPANRGTGAATVYALARLKRLDPEAVVGLFPSDHHCDDLSAFRRVVGGAFRAARHDASRIVLVGTVPDRAEGDYGWIARGVAHAKSSGAAGLPVRSVEAFVEKPCEVVAASLLASGALWNTFMLVGRLRTFFTMIEQAMPQLCASFAPLVRAVGRPTESAVAAALYEAIPAVDLSRDVLARQPERLSVIEAPAMGWTDLGRADRVLALRSRLGLESSRLTAQPA